jgi:hypothetical protein
MGRPAFDSRGELERITTPRTHRQCLSRAGGPMQDTCKSPIGLLRFAQLQGQKQKIAYVVNIRGTPMPTICKLASYRSCPVCVCV